MFMGIVRMFHLRSQLHKHVPTPKFYVFSIRIYSCKFHKITTVSQYKNALFLYMYIVSLLGLEEKP